MRRSWLLLSLVTSFHLCKAQIGVSSCNCQPSVYNFVLDFSLSCSDDEIIMGPGIVDDSCIVQGESLGTEDPVVINTIDVVEAGADGSILRRQAFGGPFNTGDSLRYVAFIATNFSDVTDTTNPTRFQVTATGVNAQDETLVGVWAAIFANDCVTSPVVEDGDNALWMSLESLGSPFPEFCPFGGFSHSPSAGPSDVPATMLPTESPIRTDPPSPIPVEKTDAPSDTPRTPSPVAVTVPPTASPRTPSPVAATTPPPMPVATPAPFQVPPVTAAPSQGDGKRNSLPDGKRNSITIAPSVGAASSSVVSSLPTMEMAGKKTKKALKDKSTKENPGKKKKLKTKKKSGKRMDKTHENQGKMALNEGKKLKSRAYMNQKKKRPLTRT